MNNQQLYISKALERAYTYKILSIIYSPTNLNENLKNLTNAVHESLGDLNGGLREIVEAVNDVCRVGKAGLLEELFGEMKKFEPLERKLVPGVAIGPTLADIAGFYAAFGMQLTKDIPMDHLAVEMEFMAHLALREAYAVLHRNEEMFDTVVDAQRKFLRDHLSRTAAYIRALNNVNVSELDKLAKLCVSFINEELRRFEIPEIALELCMEASPEDEVRCPFS
ncbi:MAG: molecular chaperone TorD family protein [Aigarchaeota archaeon]|nr:molecular chaperone TorD family protein [Candidatus Pelearchaeum maunauluense]